MREVKAKFKLTVATLLLACGVLSACGGQRVKPVSLDDPVLSEDSRKLLADSEDAVSIRRAARDDARRSLKAERKRSEELLERDWPAGASTALDALSELEQARVEFAALQLEHAQAELDLALRKYDHTTAETAMRHDLAVYELEPLKEAQQQARERVQELERERASSRRALDALESSWWQAYSAFVKGGGSSSVFYLSREGDDDAAR